MSIATIVTRGYGTFGNINFVVTRGYSIGVAAAIIGPLQSVGLFTGNRTTGRFEGDLTQARFKEPRTTGRFKP